MESRFDSSFWMKRQAWPQDKKEILNSAKIDNGAIVSKGFIEPKEVVVTADNPLGVYFIGDIEIVDLVKFCLINSLEKSIKFLNINFKHLEENKKQYLINWLSNQGILSKE